MSAFLCSDTHIAALVAYFARKQQASDRIVYHNDSRYEYDTSQDMGQILVNENYRSLEARYSDDVQAHRFTDPQVKTYSEVEILKACDCYDYQACETEDYNATLAHAIVQHIRKLAIGNLPGYERAQWEINKPPIFKPNDGR